MKIITLKQPWATLVAEGIKCIEFRSWKTNYRGKILIHAGCGIDKVAMKKFEHLGFKYPSRCIVASTYIKDCMLLTKELNEYIISLNNIAYGNKSREGYAWVLENTSKCYNVKVEKGQLGIWNIEIDENELINEQKSV